MAIIFDDEARNDIVALMEGDFNASGTVQLYYYSTVTAQPTSGFVASMNPSFNPATFAGALIAGPISGWTLDNVGDGAIEFNAGGFPPPTAATGTGVLDWVAIRSESAGSFGTIVGPVELASGGGLVEISNGGEGGGTGLNVMVGDIITTLGFRLKW